ncbi:MAG: hypothetical protein QOF88_1653 [Mycobacterium sp.]|nr:hypothetical protein [Mycobacterium sp.]
MFPSHEPYREAAHAPVEFDRVYPAHRKQHTPSRRGPLVVAGLAVAVMSASIGGVAAVAVQPYLSTLGTMATATASPATTNGPRREGVCCFRCAGYGRSNSTGA